MTPVKSAAVVPVWPLPLQANEALGSHKVLRGEAQGTGLHSPRQRALRAVPSREQWAEARAAPEKVAPRHIPAAGASVPPPLAKGACGRCRGSVGSGGRLGPEPCSSDPEAARCALRGKRKQKQAETHPGQGTRGVWRAALCTRPGVDPWHPVGAARPCQEQPRPGRAQPQSRMKRKRKQGGRSQETPVPATSSLSPSWLRQGLMATESQGGQQESARADQPGLTPQSPGAADRTAAGAGLRARGSLQAAAPLPPRDWGSPRRGPAHIHPQPAVEDTGASWGALRPAPSQTLWAHKASSAWRSSLPAHALALGAR